MWKHEYAFGGASYQCIAEATFKLILRSAGALEEPRAEAHRFAQRACERFSKDWGENVRDAYTRDEHPDLDAALEKLAGRKIKLNTEGKGRGAGERYYDLLGTSAFPDAAVVWPFRCAIEFDRQPRPENNSHLKTTLLKTAAHVLSGAYDAAIHVFVFHDQHVLDASHYEVNVLPEAVAHSYTRTFLTTLRTQGVFLAPYFPSRG